MGQRREGQAGGRAAAASAGQRQKDVQGSPSAATMLQAAPCHWPCMDAKQRGHQTDNRWGTGVAAAAGGASAVKMKACQQPRPPGAPAAPAGPPSWASSSCVGSSSVSSPGGEGSGARCAVRRQGGGGAGNGRLEAAPPLPRQASGAAPAGSGVARWPGGRGPTAACPLFRWTRAGAQEGRPAAEMGARRPGPHAPGSAAAATASASAPAGPPSRASCSSAGSLPSSSSGVGQQPGEGC